MSDFWKHTCSCEFWGYGDAKIIAINSIETERKTKSRIYNQKVEEDRWKEDRWKENIDAREEKEKKELKKELD